MLPPDHPQRRLLADEVHARPPEELQAPLRVSYLAVLIDAAAREREMAHVATLCARHGIAAPAPDATQFSAKLGPIRFRWERHGEFSAYTVFAPGLSPRPFSEPVASLLPEGWLATLPGTTVVAAHAKLVPAATAAPDAAELAEHFAGNIVIGAAIGEGVGLAYTDFCIHADGFARFLVCDRGMTARQAGRMLQRLFEIETYRMMALLALPIARAQWPRVLDVDRSLSALTTRIAADGGDDDDEALLNELTRLAAQVEGELTASQFRYGACRAYHALVLARIGELRERRLPGIQTVEEFMARRLNPAVDTVATVSRRLHDLSERVAKVSALLSPASTSSASGRTRPCWPRWTGARRCNCACSRRSRAFRWRRSSITWSAWWATSPRRAGPAAWRWNPTLPWASRSRWWRCWACSCCAARAAACARTSAPPALQARRDAGARAGVARGWRHVPTPAPRRVHASLIVPALAAVELAGRRRRVVDHAIGAAGHVGLALSALLGLPGGA